MRREGDAQCSVKLKRGGLDVEAEEGTEEVQKGSQRVADWTLKWSKARMKSKIGMYCTSQQKVDTTLYFYTSFNEHNTPYTVLESDNSESMPDVLH